MLRHWYNSEKVPQGKAEFDPRSAALEADASQLGHQAMRDRQTDRQTDRQRQAETETETEKRSAGKTKVYHTSPFCSTPQ